MYHRHRHRHRHADVHRRGEEMACVMIHVTMQHVITTMVIVLLHHLLKKVMEVLVLQAVNVLRVRVVDQIVVVVKENRVDALIVIQMVTVQHVVPIITDLTLSVTPAVVVKQVHLGRRLLLLVLAMLDITFLLHVWPVTVVNTKIKTSNPAAKCVAVANTRTNKVNLPAKIVQMEKQTIKILQPASSTHAQTPTHHPPTALPETVQHLSRTNPHVTQAATPATKDQANVVATPAPSLIPSLVQHVSMDNTKHKTLKPTHLVNFVQRVENLKQRHPNVQFVQLQNIKHQVQQTVFNVRHVPLVN